MVVQLKDQRTRLFAEVEALSSDDLSKVVGEPPRSRTLGGMILHGLHDESNHQGEIHLLKKLYTLKK